MWLQRALSPSTASEYQQQTAGTLSINQENTMSENSLELAEGATEAPRKRRATTDPFRNSDGDDAARNSKQTQSPAGSFDKAHTDFSSETIMALENSLGNQKLASMEVDTGAIMTGKRKSWDQRFEELKQYRLEHGNTLVPQKYAKNPKLGRWVENQRSQYHRYMKAIEAGVSDPQGSSSMSADRIAQLEEVDFVWIVGRGGGKRRRGNIKPSASWSQRFQELKAHKEEHGDCLIPHIYPPNPPLGRWVATQRKQYRKYTKAKKTGASDLTSGGMNEERIQLLEGVGFVWALGPGWDSNTWNVRLEELKAYKEEHGDCNVSSSYTEHPQLAKWVVNQRTQYAVYMKETNAGVSNPTVGGITADRIAKLEELGFSWSIGRGRGQLKKPPEGDQVEAGSGNSKKRAVPSRCEPEDSKYQDLQEDEWNKRVQELKEYKEEHGNLLVPTKYEKNPALGRWISNQRAQYHSYMETKQAGKSDVASRRMNEERIAELEAIGFGKLSPSPCMTSTLTFGLLLTWCFLCQSGPQRDVVAKTSMPT